MPPLRSFASRALVVVAMLAAMLGPAAERADAQGATVVISEIFYNPDGSAEGHEFLKLTNVSANPVDVSNWSFSAGVTFAFDPGTTIAPGAHHTIAADAVDFETIFGKPPDDVFVGTLANSGETLRLREAAGAVHDEVSYDDSSPWPTSADGGGDSLQLYDLSLDNSLPSSWVPGTPAPLLDNDPDLLVLFSLERGFYDGTQQVTLTSTDPTATIRYSLGPGTLTNVYAGPITLTDTGVLKVIRARASIGSTNGPIVVHSYVFAPDTGVPVVTFWRNHLIPDSAEGDARAGVIEFITPPSVPLPSSAEHTGTRTSSGGVASGQSDKFFFRGVYGAGTWNADLFSDNFFGVPPATQHDQLVLRSFHYDESMLNQTVHHDAALEMGQLAPHHRFVIFHDEGAAGEPRQLQERPEGGFMEAYTGIPKAQWLARNGEDQPRTAATAFGVDGTDLGAFEQRANAEMLIDSLINRWHSGDSDFSSWHNWRAAGPIAANAGNGADYRWNFFGWDLDFAYGNNEAFPYNTAYAIGRSPGSLWNALDGYPEMLNLMSDRIHCHLVDAGGPLTAAEMLPRADQRRLELLQANPSTSHQTQISQWWTYLQTWLPQRNNWIVDDFESRGWYVGGEAVNYTLANGLLTIDHPPGLPIWYRLDGGDPRTPRGTLDPTAVQYAGPIALPAGRTHIIARSFDSMQWGPACNEAKAFDVAVSGPDPAVVINEIHYNPADPGNGNDPELFEWIELHNPTAASYNLADASFSEGINHTFPQGITIPPGGYHVLADDAAAFTNQYGFAPDGEFGDNLANAGEALRLLAADGTTLDLVTYSDNGQWPSAPDGNGPSLSLIDPLTNNALAINWAASDTPGGTPGSANDAAAPGLVGDVNCDGQLTIVDAHLIMLHSLDARPDSGSCPVDTSVNINATIADISDDGSITVVDAHRVAMCVLGSSDPSCP